MKRKLRLFVHCLTLLNFFKLLECHLVVEDDNIAVPQTNSASFVLPAPGIRHRPKLSFQKILKSAGSTTVRRQIYPETGGIGDFSFDGVNNINMVVGNLLPEDPVVPMSQVLSLDVACQRDQMTVRVTFDQPFPGIIYSKGHYSNPQCHHVKSGSSLTSYVFTVLPGVCGTQYAESPGQPPYLENVLIIQNEPGIQEVWDTARGVRCIFDNKESDSKQTVSANLNVAMLDQKYVTFSADTEASASLDIQIGRGPFGPTASGLVRIGELMTMVVSVEGPDGADVLVRKCTAHDGSRLNTIQLTDQAGCVVKKKIMGTWQKTDNTGSSSSPVMAYAHFQAFKFPDKMDVYIECEVDLCSEACAVCPSVQVNKRIRKRKKRRINDAEMIQSETLESNSADMASAVNLAEQEEFDRQRQQQQQRLSNIINNNRLINNNNNNRLTKNGNNNSTSGGVKLAKRLRVLSPEDISLNNDDFSTITLVTKSINDPEEICLTMVNFVSGIVAMLVVLILSSVVTAILCIRIRTIPSTASTFPPDSSFHAFSTVSGKTL